MKQTARICAIGATISLLALTGVAFAHDGASSSDGTIDNAKITHNHHDQQDGAVAGHLDPVNNNIELVSKLELRNVETGGIADVGVHKGFAYLAAWGHETCKATGIHVVDIRNPAAPKEVSFLPAQEGSTPGEGVQALYIDTPQFKGDILVSNNEKCKDKTGFGGFNIYDITKPASPTVLTRGFGDETVPGQGKKAANETHSVFAWDAGNKAYAVIVDNEEGPDVDIVDITDPKKPKMVAEYDLDELMNIEQSSPSNLTQVFNHDMIVKKIGNQFVMSVSYWDGGYVLLDVTNPAAAAYLGDSDFAEIDPELLAQAGLSEAPEGNAHQSEFTFDNAYLIGADEDFSPTGLRASTDDGSDFLAVPGDTTPQIGLGDSLTGATKYVGRACPGDPAVSAGDGTQIAVVVRGLCTFTEKVAAVETAGGYVATLVINREGADGCSPFGMAVEGAIPSFSVDRATGYGLFDVGAFDLGACLAGAAQDLPGVALGAIGDTVTVESFFDGWGYVRLFKTPLNGGKLVEVDTYAIPEAMDPAYAEGFGDLSVHEVATSLADNRLAYLSYYSGGLRVIAIENDQIVEKGSFIDANGNNFWGVEVFNHNGVEYVAASDRDHGLYIFKYTPSP